MKFKACIGLLLSCSCLAQSQALPRKLEKMPEPLEARFALSAAPPHLRENATVYILDPTKGYALSHQGTNGVSCIVVRSDWQWASPPFRNDIYWPVCYDSEGSKTLLQDYFYAA